MHSYPQEFVLVCRQLGEAQQRCSAALAAQAAHIEALQAEVFGSTSLVVKCADLDEVKRVTEHLEGQLTATLQMDDGDVEASNLQRQTLYNERDIGHGKATCAKRWVTGFDPELTVEISDQRLSTANAPALLEGADLVLDGTDNFATRLAVSDACVKAGVPLLSAAVGRFQGQVGAFAGHRDGEACYRCFVGDAFDAEDCDTCAEDGMLGAMAGWVGTFAAMQAIRILLDGASSFGQAQWSQVQLLDGMAPSLRSFRIAKDPACSACGSAA